MKRKPLHQASGTQDAGLTRREAIKGVVGLGMAAAFPGCSSVARHEGSGASSDRIRRENEKPGTRDWMLTNTRTDPATKYRCPWIEGYCSHTSARAGESITFHVSTNPASSFTFDIYRMGFYGGSGGRLVRPFELIKGVAQNDPPVGRNRVRDCQWEPSLTVKIPDDWLSGIYLAKLTSLREGVQSYVIFIVRDTRRADYIFQCSDTTWQAYNRWPSQFALYDDGKNQLSITRSRCSTT